MQVAHSVIGFVPDDEAKRLQAGGSDVVEVPIQAGKRETLVRIKQQDVDEVRLGPSRGGHTSVQLMLKPGASYDYVLKPSADDFMQIFEPGLHYGGRPPINVIMVPNLSQKVSSKA